MAPAITIRSSSYSYFENGPSALSECSFHIPAGQCAAILGPAGSGKTTLLHMLSGIMGAQFTTGRATGAVTIGDQTFDPIPSKVLFPTVGYFMQDAAFQLSGIMESVLEEVSFALDNLGISGRDRTRRLNTVLSKLDLTHLEKRNLKQLSGGELQRVALASLLVAEPPVLLLDEPISALDSSGQHRLSTLLRSMSGTTTIVLTDSSIDFALRVADTFIVIESGTVIFSGDRASFLASLSNYAHLLPVQRWNEATIAAQQPHISQRIKRLIIS